MKLVGIEPLLKIIQLNLQTAYIEPYKPTSLLIIAKPESCKTMAQLVFRELDNVYFTTEITAKMLLDNILPSVAQGKIKHIIIPDILNCIEKQKSTRQQFLNTVKSGIEEGILKIESYHKRFSSDVPVIFGMITAITTTDFKKQRKYLEDIGLLSRFIPFTFDYPINKIKEIFEVIESDKVENQDLKKFLKIKKTKVKIEGSPELFKSFELISSKLGNEYSGYGFRIQKNLQQLAKANALLNDRKKVAQEDIREIFELSNWINFDFNTM